MERACDDDELVDRCDGCGGVLEEPWDDDDSLVIYDCFHVLHARCAFGRDACPRCDTPRRVHDGDDLQPEQVDEAAAASPPDNNRDKDSALASDGVGNDDDRPGGGETGEPRSSCCDGDFIKPGDGESPAASMSVSGCNHHASRLGCCACCSRRVTELEGRLEEKSAALTETTTVLDSELERAQSRLSRLEKMYDKLEEEFIRLRNDKRERERSRTPRRKEERGREIDDEAKEQEEAAADRREERFMEGVFTDEKKMHP